jgi:hypothetical protein
MDPPPIFVFKSGSVSTSLEGKLMSNYSIYDFIPSLNDKNDWVNDVTSSCMANANFL